MPDEESRLKVLLVVAHPDDESECAATLYRVTHEIGGVVDQVIITNGEAGHQYSAPAQAYYRSSADEESWRKDLVGIRRGELRRAGRILGVRRHYFLNQKDTGLTWDSREGLEAWDIEHVRKQLCGLLRCQNYDLVFMLLPSLNGHGHHQTAAILTLQAIATLEEQRRPAALGVQTADSFGGLEAYPLTRTATSEPAWRFDRRTRLHCHSALDYSIVVNWVIAEHKSQGMFQMEFGKRTHENFWLFDVCGSAGEARWRSFLALVGLEMPGWNHWELATDANPRRG
jgi:LmbE family N-acetylglucosaminyl deacetylase